MAQSNAAFGTSPAPRLRDAAFLIPRARWPALLEQVLIPPAQPLTTCELPQTNPAVAAGPTTYPAAPNAWWTPVNWLSAIPPAALAVRFQTVKHW